MALRSFEDWDFEIRLLRISRVLILPEVLAKVRRFDDATRLDRPLPTPHGVYAPTSIISRYTDAPESLKRRWLWMDGPRMCWHNCTRPSAPWRSRWRGSDGAL